MYHVDEYDQGEDIVPLTNQKRGGTDLRAIFSWLEENHIEPKGMAILTDAYTPFPEAPTYPVLWVLTPDHGEVPFGETVILS